MADENKDAQEQKSQPAGDFLNQAEEKSSNFVSEFADYMLDIKKWWLMPIIIILLLFAILMVLTATPLAPFIYTFF